MLKNCFKRLVNTCCFPVTQESNRGIGFQGRVVADLPSQAVKAFERGRLMFIGQSRFSLYHFSSGPSVAVLM